jgi:hypothetical protein
VSSPATLLRAAPVLTWPLDVVDDEGRPISFAAAVGPGGERVSDLLDALTGAGAGDVGTSAPLVAGSSIEVLAPQTPAGRVDLPLVCVDLVAGAEAAAGVDPSWLADVDRRRMAARAAVVAAGREDELEAALHVAMLVATGRLDAGVDARVASGARLWLLAGAVASALAGAPDPFHAWGRLVAAGWWPVGPSRGRLVMSASA